MAILSDDFYYQPIRIDTINTRVYADLLAKEGDANGRGLLVTLTENGLMKDTTGIALNLKWEHTSVGNQGLDNFEAVDLSKGLYKITYPTEMLNRGKVRAFIQIIDSGKLAGTRNIEITVDRGVGDDTAIASSDSFTALAQALIDVNNLESTYAPELLSVKQQLADKADRTALAVEKARIDSFTTLPSGSTTGDAELFDARVGDTGIVSKSLGQHIRIIEKGMKKAVREGFLEIDTGEWEIGSISTLGIEVESSIEIRSGYISIPYAEMLKVKINDGYKLAIRFYDDDKVFVKAIGFRTGVKTFDHYPFARFIVSSVSGNTVTDTSYSTQCEIQYTSKANYLYEYFPVELGTIEQGTFGTLNENYDGDVNSLRTSKYVKFGKGKTVKVEVSAGWRYRVYGSDVPVPSSESPATLFIGTYSADAEFLSQSEYLRFTFAYYPNDIRQTVLLPDEYNDSIRFLTYFLETQNNSVVAETGPYSTEDIVVGDEYVNNIGLGLVDVDGFVVESDVRVSTGFVKAFKNTTFYLKEPLGFDGVFMAQYDNEKKLVERKLYSETQTTLIDGWVRLMVRYADQRIITDLTPFLNNIVAQPEHFTENISYLSGDFSSYYETPNYTGVTTSALAATSILDVYSAYDAELAKYPNIMAKKLLGYGCDVNGAADNNLPIYEYSINALTGIGVKSPPKILVSTGLHGQEKTSVWSTLQFVTQLLNDWGNKPNLESLLSNVTLKIVPVSNPSGYNTNTRNNARGVDLNRNFSYKWTEYVEDGLNEFPSYKGANVYSELETQIMRDWLIANKNAIGFWDFHNLVSDVVYTATPNENLKSIFTSILRRLSTRWNVRYGVLESGKTQGYITDYELPMLWREGIVQGIQSSALVEVGRTFAGVEYSKEVIERGIELLSNYILGVLDFYSKGSF